MSSGFKTPPNYRDSAKANKTAADAIIDVLKEGGQETEKRQEEGELVVGNLLSGRKLYLALAGLDALLFIAALDLTIIATVYVEIANSFNSLSRAEWTVTSYMLASTAIQPLFGKFSDIMGRAEAIVVSVLLFAVGSVMCAMSRSMDMLIASRAVQGLGGGGIMSLIFIVIADVLSERERGKYIGVFTCTWGFASAIAPILGGIIVQRSDWRLIFWINLPVCALALGLVLFFMRLPRPTGSIRQKLKKIDFLGTTIFLAGALPFLLGLSWGGREYSWTSPLVLGCVIGGMLALIVFLLFEWYVPQEPIIPSRLLGVRNVALSAVGHFFYGAAAYGPIVFVPQWALIVRGVSAISAGAHLLPFTIGTIVTSVLGGFVMTRTGRYRRLIMSGAVLLAIGNSLLVLFDQKISMTLQSVILVLCGLGAGACIQPIMMAAQASVSGHDMAAVTTLCAFLRSLGGIICVAVLSSIMHSVIKDGLTDLAMEYPQFIFTILEVAENQSVIYSDGVSPELRAMIVAIFMGAMRLAFFALIPFSVLLVLVTLGFKHAELGRQRKQTIE
ncbi:major facilitator superfamily-domain-containing protein [Kickxella alabastrina]|uniref:major facilitator superfamily-domain-containing protein n=1 Tax=Kickxella alabastrina TaxID=61397 RepID=UPI00221E777A|nr:major facilitator superfamily-domain-containing protein [Kickxella alabastrina]KAI7825053.1 major facilitator superfamily-domain-containing protein [Kickxella alabastrina]